MIGATEFVVVFDGAGDPYALQAVMPRCHGCHRMLRGDCVKVTTAVNEVLLYHKQCVPKPA